MAITPIDATTITSGIVDGTGYFDKFMTSLNAHIDAQYDLGRIQGPDFAQVYLGALQLGLQQAVQYAQVVSNVALLDQKLFTEQAQILDTVDGVAVAGAVGQQKLLQAEQVNAFVRDAEQKAAKIVMDAWSVSKSISGDAVLTPDGAQNDDIEEFLIALRNGVGVTSSIYKFTANAGVDRVGVNPASTVQLDASGSTYPGLDETGGETISSYLWTQIDGLAAVTFSPNATSEQVTFTGTTGLAYIFQLKITGSAGTTSYDTVSITMA